MDSMRSSAVMVVVMVLRGNAGAYRIIPDAVEPAFATLTRALPAGISSVGKQPVVLKG